MAKVHLAGVNPYPASCYLSVLSGGGVAQCTEEQAKRLLMKIFLAGGISGNLQNFGGGIADKLATPEHSEIVEEKKVFKAAPLSRAEIVEGMKVFKAAPLSRAEIVEGMKVFIAGGNGEKKLLEDKITAGNIFAGKGDDVLRQINILESFYYLRNNKDFMPIVKHFGSFLLDSGAFTFLSGSHKGEIDWDKYVEEYAIFINQYDIQLFFELDIDSIVGIEEVERLRYKLESLTNKKPIPVWHKSRGKEYFIKMCKEYPYVAVGGIVTKEIPRQIYEKAFPWFIQTAHKYGAKIHGLGYTTIANLKKYHFDSVDSTAWLYGNRGGYLYKFNPRTGLMEKYQVPNSRLKSRAGAVHNFNEWIKFSQYAEQYL